MSKPILIEITGDVTARCRYCDNPVEVEFIDEAFGSIEEFESRFIHPSCAFCEAEETKAEAEIKEGKEV